MFEESYNLQSNSTKKETKEINDLSKKIRSSLIPDKELPNNLGIYLTRQNLSRINFIQEIYKLILPVHGSIVEFGVRWGQNLCLFSSLRGIHEPYNYNRKILGFDTFNGFPSLDDKDSLGLSVGDYSIDRNWKNDLEDILDFHNMNSPIPHIKKYELIEGDASKTFPKYLSENPETIISLAYFDFDIYKPTHDCLKALLPHLTKGSVLAFDELNVAEFRGETIALSEVIGLSKYSIKRFPFSPLTSYIVIE